jgi:hypothetical protein
MYPREGGSYKQLLALEAQMRAEVEQLFRLADQTDPDEIPARMNLSDEIALRHEHFPRLASAKRAFQARAYERQAAEHGECEAKLRQLKGIISLDHYDVKRPFLVFGHEFGHQVNRFMVRASKLW